MKFIKRIFIFIIVLAAVSAGAMLILPGTYEARREVSVKAHPLKVFAVARILASWNTLASMSRLKDMPELPAGVLDQLPIPGGQGAGKLLKGMMETQKKLASSLKVTETRFPESFRYELEGGAYDGLKAQVVIKSADGGALVSLEETLVYEGFFAPVKAFTTKLSRQSLMESDLQKLKEAVE
ncbi:MAG: hypothetical protein HS115_03540 [Spirochaetales bacterium]|nr:hypothetical protein [Spirochaetales bacterium]